MISVASKDKFSIFVPVGFENDVIFSFFDDVFFPGCTMKVCHDNGNVSEYNDKEIKEFFYRVCASGGSPFTFNNSANFKLGCVEVDGTISFDDKCTGKSHFFVAEHFYVLKIVKGASTINFVSNYPKNRVVFFTDSVLVPAIHF